MIVSAHDTWLNTGLDDYWGDDESHNEDCTDDDPCVECRRDAYYDRIAEERYG